MAYNVSNPHPLYGKDPNFINEFGHTQYPKWIDHPTDKEQHPVTKKQIPKRVLVENADEEAEVTGKSDEKKPKGWDKK